jgi:hypothetical protein
MLVPLLAAAAAATSVNVPATLDDRIDRVKDRSGISVLLPETIRTEFDRVHTASKANRGRYVLVIGAAPKCNGASVCSIVNFYGADGVTFNGGRKVQLAKGRNGRYYKSRCGANCSFPLIAWREKGVMYQIEYKEAGGKRAMIRLANQAIRAGAR